MTHLNARLNQAKLIFSQAMLSLSKGIGVASTERVVKHVLDGADDDKRYIF